MKLGDTEYGWPHAIIAICGVLTMSLTLINTCMSQRHDAQIQRNSSQLNTQRDFLLLDRGSNYVQNAEAKIRLGNSFLK